LQLFEYCKCHDVVAETFHFVIKNGYIYVYRYLNFKRWFSEDGTLQALVKDLHEYIKLGTSANGTNGYGGMYCRHWSYPEESMKVFQQKVIDIGFSNTIVEDLFNYN